MFADHSFQPRTRGNTACQEPAAEGNVLHTSICLFPVSKTISHSVSDATERNRLLDSLHLVGLNQLSLLGLLRFSLIP